MHTLTTPLIVFNFVLIMTLITPEVNGQGTREVSKIRRGGTMTIYPHPRVGRSQFGSSWLVNPEELGNSREIKRQGLIPFPRVGRTVSTYDKYLNSGAMDGLWIVPRPGRVTRRKIDSAESQIPIIAFRGVFPSPDFTPRLGREFEESSEDEQLEQSDQM